MPRQAENLIGRVYGTRKVVARAPSRDYAGNKTIYWSVRCEKCGATAEVQGGSLKRGAGCHGCRTGEPPVRRPAKPAEAKAARHAKAGPGVSEKQTKTMTLGQVRAALSELSPNTEIWINLVGKQGTATVTVKDLSTVGGVVMLVGTLPTRIEPWANE